MPPTSKGLQPTAEAMEFEQLAEFRRGWVAAQAEREALVIACLEAFFECATNEIPECKVGYHYQMQEALRIVLFDHRADFVPKGRNRQEYLTELWKTGDGEFILEDCLGIVVKLAELNAEEATKMKQF